MSSPWLSIAAMTLSSGALIGCAVTTLRNRQLSRRNTLAWARYDTALPAVAAADYIRQAIPNGHYVDALDEGELRRHLHLVGQVAAAGIGAMHQLEDMAGLAHATDSAIVMVRDADEGPPASPIGPEDDPSWGR